MFLSHCAVRSFFVVVRHAVKSILLLRLFYLERFISLGCVKYPEKGVMETNHRFFIVSNC